MADSPKMEKMITVRLTPELHAKVIAKAHSEGPGFSVGELLRSTLETWVGVKRKPAAKTKPTPAASVCPPHPKGARQAVNAELGLFRCGACGEMVK